jgi:hypothetical protein
VWTDEFEALGLSHTLECSWPDAACYFGEGKEVSTSHPLNLASSVLLTALLGWCLPPHHPGPGGKRVWSCEQAQVEATPLEAVQGEWSGIHEC